METTSSKYLIIPMGNINDGVVEFAKEALQTGFGLDFGVIEPIPVDKNLLFIPNRDMGYELQFDTYRVFEYIDTCIRGYQSISDDLRVIGIIDENITRDDF